jgi:SOS-response transcriptional repressor LexA
VYKQPGQLILLAENKSYMPMTYNEGSNEEIQIIGKAVGYQHWF